MKFISISRFIDSPITWALAGFVIGVLLGVTTPSVWLLTIGLVLFLFYLKLHGHAHKSSEGKLFAAGPVFIVCWVIGFIVRGLVL